MLTFKQAILVAAIFEFASAVLVVGSHVTDTVRKGIVPPDGFVLLDRLMTAG